MDENQTTDVVENSETQSTAETPVEEATVAPPESTVETPAE